MKLTEERMQDIPIDEPEKTKMIKMPEEDYFDMLKTIALITLALFMQGCVTEFPPTAH